VLGVLFISTEYRRGLIRTSLTVTPRRGYVPVLGFYPLAPWAGFAVLCAWTALALGVAGYLLRRRDV
jgi:hypothetical protein